MIQFYKESKLSVFSRHQCSIDSCSSSDIFSDSYSFSESESASSSQFPTPTENPVQLVIENEAYCFNVERFSEKLVDAIFLEAKQKLSKPTPVFTIFDIVGPLIDILISKVFNIEPYKIKPEFSESSSLVTLSKKPDQVSPVWPKISEFNIKLGQEQIEQYVDTWKRSRDWLFCVEFLGFESEDCSNVFVYEVEWSKPTKSYPIPQATASVYFALEVYKIVPHEHDRSVDVSYVFEYSTLIHKPGKIEFQEQWLQNIIDEKIKFFKKMPFSVPAGICSPTRPTLGEGYWPNSIANLKCSKRRRRRVHN